MECYQYSLWRYINHVNLNLSEQELNFVWLLLISYVTYIVVSTSFSVRIPWNKLCHPDGHLHPIQILDLHPVKERRRYL